MVVIHEYPCQARDAQLFLDTRFQPLCTRLAFRRGLITARDIFIS